MSKAKYSIPELGLWDRSITFPQGITVEQAIIGKLYPDLDGGPGKLAAIIDGQTVELTIPDLEVPGVRKLLERYAEENGLELSIGKSLYWTAGDVFWHHRTAGSVFWQFTFMLTERTEKPAPKMLCGTFRTKYSADDLTRRDPEQLEYWASVKSNSLDNTTEPFQSWTDVLTKFAES